MVKGGILVDFVESDPSTAFHFLGDLAFLYHVYFRRIFLA